MQPGSGSIANDDMLPARIRKVGSIVRRVSQLTGGYAQLLIGGAKGTTPTDRQEVSISSRLDRGATTRLKMRQALRCNSQAVQSATKSGLIDQC